MSMTQVTKKNMGNAKGCKSHITLLFFQRVTVFHFALHHEEDIFGIIRPHFAFFLSLLDYKIHHFVQVNVDITVFIGFRFQTFTGCVVFIFTAVYFTAVPLWAAL